MAHRLTLREVHRRSVAKDTPVRPLAYANVSYGRFTYLFSYMFNRRFCMSIGLLTRKHFLNGKNELEGSMVLGQKRHRWVQTTAFW
jgi:hypothetical protein